MNEITVSINFGCIKGNYNPGTIRASGLKFDQDAVGAAGDTQEIGTSEETLATADLTTFGWLYMRNLDPDNYVQFGFSTGVYGGRMEPGEPVLFRTEPGGSIYLKANTAACNIQYRWLED